MNGYDISDNQGNIDNSIVPGDFVFIKATEGVGYTDPDCDPNYQQSKNAGKKIGVYHFARPDGNDPISEANWFVSQVKGYIGEAILALDFETNPMTVDWAHQWLNRVFELTGVKPLLYATLSTINSLDWSPVYNENYGLWVASWGQNQPQNGYNVPTNLPDVNWNPNAPYALWQYTSKGRLDNWGSYLDLNVFYGDRNTWQAYASVQNSQPPTPPVVIPPVAPVDPPITPTEPSEPVEPVTPVEPTEPTTPSVPVEPVQPKKNLAYYIAKFFSWLFAQWKV